MWIGLLAPSVASRKFNVIGFPYFFLIGKFVKIMVVKIRKAFFTICSILGKLAKMTGGLIIHPMKLKREMFYVA